MPRQNTVAHPWSARPGLAICTSQEGSVGNDCANANQVFTTLATTWGAAKLVVYIPFIVSIPCTAYQMGLENGAVLSGNLDIGIHEIDGTLLINSGSTAQAGTSVKQRVNITDTALVPGSYFASLTFDNAVATLDGAAALTRACRTMGCREQITGTFGLPATAVFSNFTTMTLVPSIWVETRSVT